MTDYLSPMFAICSSRRSGSHFLQSALNAHPDLKVAGEALTFPQENGLRPGRGLLDRIWQHYNGFILHRNGKHPAWTTIRRRPCKIISLKRLDLLAMYVSEQIAKKTKVWRLYGDQSQPLTTVRIDVKAAGQYIRMRQEEYDHFDRFLKRRPICQVTYEALCSNFSTEMRRIQEFLGVRVCDVAAACLKQESRPLAEVVENYAEVRDGFET